MLEDRGSRQRATERRPAGERTHEPGRSNAGPTQAAMRGSAGGGGSSSARSRRPDPDRESAAEPARDSPGIERPAVRIGAPLGSGSAASIGAAGLSCESIARRLEPPGISAAVEAASMDDRHRQRRTSRRGAARS